MEDLKSLFGRHYVGGDWARPKGQERFPVINPATEEAIGEIALASEEDVGDAVGAAARAFESFSRTSRDERLGILGAILDETRKRLPDLARAITLDVGAPATMSLEQQADAGVGHLEAFIDALKAQEPSVKLKNGDELVREPIGVCGLVTPWNWPVNQIALKALPAIAAGCSFVLKPSEFTPLSSILYMQILHDAGVPPGVCNMVQGKGPVAGAALSRHPDIAMMSFTGSVGAGRAVTRDSAETVKRVTLELGGKSPNLVFADCGEGLREAVERSVAECFLNTGQSCDAPTLMLAEAPVYEEVKEIAAEAARATRLDSPEKEGGHLGPLISQIQLDRVQAYIEKGVSEGAALLAGGPGKPEGMERGYWTKPTVFGDVKPEMTIAREEIFGPVLAIQRFEGEEEAIGMANATTYGLAAYVQSGDLDRARRIAGRLRAGAVHINGGYVGYGTPYGGYKQSGSGREGGKEGLEDYQEIKSLHFPAQG